MLYIKKVFEHLPLWWVGIWMHIHSITIINVAPDLGELAEVLGGVCVKMMHLRYG